MNSRWDQLGIPTPGSARAVDQGCICPILDNRRGAGVAIQRERTFWITAGCPLHTAAEDWALL